MIKTYIKIAFRNLFKNKVYSLINIVGLTIGLTACLLVSTVVIDELSYDRFWKRSSNIYRVIDINNNKEIEEKGSQSMSGLGPEMKKTFSEVQAYCRMNVSKERIKMGDKEGVSLNILNCEPSVWNVLDFTVIQGSPEKFVKGYKNLVISENIKRQYFPNEEPIGKILKNVPAFGNAEEFLVTGIIKDIPANTHLRSEALLIEELEPENFDKLTSTLSGNYTTQYVVLAPGVDLNKFTAKVNNWYLNDILEIKTKQSFEFQPVDQVYLRSDFEAAKVQGSIRNVYIFSGIAALLLLIGCINFINLTTARSLKRVQEVGVRKVLGAGKKDLIAQFLFESIIFFSISFVLSILLYNFCINPLQAYLGHALVFTLSHNLGLFAVTCGLLVLISLLTGFYPAWLISGSKLGNVLKGKLSNDIDRAWLRKSLIVGQFVISITIIISTIVVQNQLTFIGGKDLGYDKNNLLVLDYSEWGTKSPAFKQELLNLRNVVDASITSWYPSNGGAYMTAGVTDPRNADSQVQINYIGGDKDLVSTLKLQLKKGRLLTKADSHLPDSVKKTNPHGNFLLTEYTATRLNVKKLNQTVNVLYGFPVGIVKDFHSESLRSTLKPTVIQIDDDISYGYGLIRIKPGPDALENIHKVFQKFYPEKAFEFSWVDELLEAQYRTEFKLQQLFVSFSFLIIFLACLGLFGLVSFTVEQRVKEIGIRKVLGASVEQISYLISKDFLVLVFLALIIATPIAWLAMNKWLEDFAYRIEIQWWMFILAGSVAVLIALITVSFQSIKAALANPVESLRSE